MSKFPILSRPDAFTAGSARYYTGRPCKYGHDSQRFTTSGACVECLAQRQHMFRAARTGNELRIGPQTYHLARGQRPTNEFTAWFIQQMGRWLESGHAYNTWLGDRNAPGLGDNVDAPMPLHDRALDPSSRPDEDDYELQLPDPALDPEFYCPPSRPDEDDTQPAPTATPDAGVPAGTQTRKLSPEEAEDEEKIRQYEANINAPGSRQRLSRLLMPTRLLEDMGLTVLQMLEAGWTVAALRAAGYVDGAS